jgi:hypothetical protein
MISNTRHGHNELLLKRNVDDKKRQPDYIIAVDNIKPKDIKAAKEFGIPIVLLNSEKIIQYNIERMLSIISDLYETMDINKLQELIVLYNNNYSGMITFNKNSIKYLKSIDMEAYLMECAQRIVSTGDKKLINDFIMVMNNEFDKYYRMPEEYIPYNYKVVIEYLMNSLSMVDERTTTTEKNNMKAL